MKKFQRWMGVLLIGFAASSLFVACGDDDDASCLVDSDCYDNESCNLATQVCALTCTDDASICQGDEVCTPGLSETGSICVSEGGDVEPECTTETDCPGDQVCNSVGVCVDDTTSGECVTADDCSGDDICVDEMCVTPGETNTYFFAQLVDTTQGEGCNGSDPGSDIFGIELTKAADNSKAYALAINGNITGNHSRTDFDSVLDGNPSGYDGSACLEFSESFSLGCGGDVVVEFLDSNGARVEISDSDSILVMEYGGTCSGGTDDDSWRLNTCSADASRNDLVGDTSACNGTLQGESEGLNTVTISL